MRKLLIAIILTTFALCSIAQGYHPFPTDSAQWSVFYENNIPFYVTSWQYKMNGDTLLNGLVYHKIYYSLDLAYSSPNQTLQCFVREDTSKRVYVKYPLSSGYDTTEFVLYDFNLSSGDTATIRLLNYTTDSIFILGVGSPYAFGTFIDVRLCHPLSLISTPIWLHNCDMLMEWVEGIGSNVSPFYNEIPQNGCANGWYHMNCFWERGVYVLGGGICDPNTGVSRSNISKYSQIYPNPITDMSIMDIVNKGFTRLEIYNVLGQKVKTMDINLIHKVFLNKNDFSKGIFIYKLIGPYHFYDIGRFVVE